MCEKCILFWHIKRSSILMCLIRSLVCLVEDGFWKFVEAYIPIQIIIPLLFGGENGEKFRERNHNSKFISL